MVFEDNFLPVNCQRRAGGGSKEDRFVTGLANASMFSEKEFFFEIMTEDNTQKDLSFGSLNSDC